MEKISLVLVDDHRMFLEGMRVVLKAQQDIEVIAILNEAKNAIKAIKKQQPDLLITDISMPEINGIEFIKKVKEIYPNQKILVVSMFSQTQEIQGIHGYILKETGYEELISTIRNIVLEDKKYLDVNTKKENSLEFKKNILTNREKEIVKLIANENTTDEIADILFLSKHTVETHKKNIFQKLNVSNAAGLIKKSFYLGYIE